MELRHLRYFVMTAEEGNVSRASERLFVSQPAVSRQIKDLEEELGIPLFKREPSGLSLTPAGETALVHAREVLAKAEGLRMAMEIMTKRKTRDTLRVGYLPTALPSFLAEGMRLFNQQVKDVCLQISEMSPVEQENALRHGEIDLGLIGDPDQVFRNEFAVKKILKTEVVMIVPEDHPLATRKSVLLSEFAHDHFTTLNEEKFPGRAEMTAELFGKAGISPEVVTEAGGLSELLGTVGAGGLVALAPADLVHLPHSGVSFLPIKKPKKTLFFSAAWRKDNNARGLLALVELITQRDQNSLGS